MEFKDQLKELRLNQNLTQESLANILHISRSLVARFENGLSLPTKDTLQDICNYFKVEPNYLLPNQETEEKLVSKNNIIHQEKRKSFILLILIGIILVSACLSIGFLLNEKQILKKQTFTSMKELKIELYDMPKNENELVFIGESGLQLTMQEKDGYATTQIQVHRIKDFTDVSDLYLIHAMTSFTPGMVAYYNDEHFYRSNATISSVFTQFETNQQFDNYYTLKKSFPLNETDISYFSSSFNGKIQITSKINLIYAELFYENEDTEKFEYNKNTFSFLNDKLVFLTDSTKNSFKSEYKIKKDYQTITTSADNCYLLEIKNDSSFELNFNYNIGFTSSNKTYSNFIQVKCSFK